MTNTREIDLLPKLNSALAQQNWDELSKFLNPKLFKAVESEDLVAFPTLAKVAHILTTEGSIIPDTIKIACLKCLGNSCLNGYKYKEYSPNDIVNDKYCSKLYSALANGSGNLGEGLELSKSYPYDSHFPYEGIAEWTSNYIISRSSNVERLLDTQLEILRLSVQFLCNLFTFACKDSNYPDYCDIPKCLNNTNLKSAIMNLSHSEHVLLVRASCVFIHNALKELEESYFTVLEKNDLCSQLLKPIKKGFESAKEALLLLLRHTNVLQSVYKSMLIEDKLYLLQIIYNEASESVYNSKEGNILNAFTRDTIEFLSERFCKRSDLILKTVDSYLNDMEPTEIVILLDILGVLTSGNLKEYSFLKDDRSLLINCTYLLKSIQMVGKESNNYFTPMQKLSDVAPAVQGITINNESSTGPSTAEKLKSVPHSHPAFGFKAGLIRIIGNMSYKNKMCQDLLREMDAIPLLLDCCNIDARNPLIMQWTILALRNLCEGNLENQEIVRNCTRVGVVENSVLKEMGLTLHEDEEGKKVGIVPLVRNQDK